MQAFDAQFFCFAQVGDVEGAVAAAVGVPVPAARSLFLAGGKAGVWGFKAKGTGVFYPAVPCGRSKCDDAGAIAISSRHMQRVIADSGITASHPVLPFIQSYTDVLYRKYSSACVICQMCIGTFFREIDSSHGRVHTLFDKQTVLMGFRSNGRIFSEMGARFVYK